ETVELEGLLPEGSRVLVAVSGGADSVCLLEFLRIIAPRRGLTLAGFHLNHRLRPAAHEDERFVRTLFEQARLPLKVVRSDVRGYARRHRLGIEGAGRELRYRHMGATARKLGCQRVALGHTADDSLETVLLNIIRGTGLTGFRGIPARREYYVRPLIELTRVEIEAWLCAQGVAWREDESNRDERYARNLLRRRVIPVLRELRPNAAVAARRAARLIADEDDCLEEEARAALSTVARRVRSGARIDLAALLSYNICLKRRMVRRLIPGMDSSGVDRILLFLTAMQEQGPRHSAAKLVLPGGTRLTRLSTAAGGRTAILVTRKGGHGR
ncbi:MAG TPA: tRNA lysidine(34) synthetase TilS, partial [candidate division WOR-3 bacterium]|nr:tRNA lysidine(34) synthetase TilS [candidate division WOR-3 bacterium]